MKHDEIMYKMANLAMEKEAKFGSKIKPGIKKLYKGYVNALKGYPEDVRFVKENISTAKEGLKGYPNSGHFKKSLSGHKKSLRKLRTRALAARGATGAAALGGGYGTYRAIRKRPAE